MTPNPTQVGDRVVLFVVLYSNNSVTSPSVTGSGSWTELTGSPIQGPSVFPGGQKVTHHAFEHIVTGTETNIIVTHGSAFVWSMAAVAVNMDGAVIFGSTGLYSGALNVWSGGESLAGWGDIGPPQIDWDGTALPAQPEPSPGDTGFSLYCLGVTAYDPMIAFSPFVVVQDPMNSVAEAPAEVHLAVGASSWDIDNYYLDPYMRVDYISDWALVDGEPFNPYYHDVWGDKTDGDPTYTEVGRSPIYGMVTRVYWAFDEADVPVISDPGTNKVPALRAQEVRITELPYNIRSGMLGSRILGTERRGRS